MTFFDSGVFGPMGLFGWSGEEIYRNFHDGTGDDGRGLTHASSSVQELMDHYQARVDSIVRLTTTMESAWQGAAAGAARRGAAPLAVEHATAQESMTAAQYAMTDQTDVFTSAKKSVQRIPPTPDKPGLWENVTSLGDAGRNYENEMTQINAANDANVAVMESYEGATEANASRMPTSYGSIEADQTDVGVRKPLPWPPGPVKPIRPPEQVHNPTDRDGRDDARTTTPPSTHDLTGTTRTSSDIGTRTPGDLGQTRPEQYTPPRVADPPRVPVPPGGQPGGPGQHLPPFVGPGGFPGGGQGGGPGGGPRGGGPGGGGGGRGGFGPRGGGFGPGGSGGAGGAGGGSGAGGRGPGGGFGQGGAGAAAAAEGAAGRGGAGGAGGAGGRGGGTGGMGGMGGNRGKGGADGEHERPSFLVEPDPHETFGSDEVTAPPVIGE